MSEMVDVARSDEEASKQRITHPRLALFMLPFVLIGLLVVLMAAGSWFSGIFNESPRDDGTQNAWYGEQVDFEAVHGSPALRAVLSESGESRFREIRVQFGADADTVGLGINAPEFLQTGVDGIAVRTTNSATLLSRTELVEIRRPRNCGDECEIRLWLTMHATFIELNPGAEILVFVGDSGAAAMRDIDALPARAHQ